MECRASNIIVKSFGLIACCISTSSWLVVRRKVSPAYICILTGACRDVNYPDIVPALVESEAKKLLAAAAYYTTKEVTTKNESHILADLFHGLHIPPMDDLGKRLDNRFLRTTLLAHEGKYPIHQPWGWPKGRADAKEVAHPVSCAIREFQEETGLEIKESEVINSSELPVIVASFRSHSGINVHEAGYWVTTVDAQPVLPDISTMQDEIALAMWLPEAELPIELQGNVAIAKKIIMDAIHTAESVAAVAPEAATPDVTHPGS